MSEASFDALTSDMSASGAEAALERLADQFRTEKQYHDLFDARLMQARHRLGLPVISSQSLEDLPEPTRSQVEDAYLEACREVGNLLLADGRIREAWMYLRPLGDKTPVIEALEKVEPDDETLEEIIEIALNEGVAPARGFQLVLEHYGTCNAITTFEGAIPHQPLAAQQQAADMLVRHLHDELLGNVRAHVEDHTGKSAEGIGLGDLCREHEWLFENDNYHIDTSHLASTVRFARLVEDPETIRLALDLTEYGRRLSEQFQFPGEEPFVDLYPSHALLFAASLGERVDEAVDYFRKKAETVNAQEEGTGAIETYLILLRRLGRDAEALEAVANYVPQGVQLSSYAPKMIELARSEGNYSRYLEICRERGDLLAFAAGLVESSSADNGSNP